jgi:hypothetical protein
MLYLSHLSRVASAKLEQVYLNIGNWTTFEIAIQQQPVVLQLEAEF